MYIYFLCIPVPVHSTIQYYAVCSVHLCSWHCAVFALLSAAGTGLLGYQVSSSWAEYAPFQSHYSIPTCSDDLVTTRTTMMMEIFTLYDLSSTLMVLPLSVLLEINIKVSNLRRPKIPPKVSPVFLGLKIVRICLPLFFHDEPLYYTTPPITSFTLYYIVSSSFLCSQLVMFLLM